MIDNGTSEIDLKNIFKNILYSIFRHRRTFSFCMLSCIVFSAAFFTMQRTKYFLTYSISSDYMSGQKIELIYADIKKLIQLKQYDRLSILLNLPLDEAKKIISFSVEVEEPSASLQTSNNFKADFHFNETNTAIQITLTDTIHSTTLVNTLNQFISSSNYFQKIKRNELVSIEKINQNLELEKKELDSLNGINLNKFMKSNGNVVLLNELSQIKQNMYIIQERLINNKRGVDRIEEPINLINHPIRRKQSMLSQILYAIGKGLLVTGLLFAVYSLILWFKTTYADFKLQAS
jgi:hypothetical protein